MSSEDPSKKRKPAVSHVRGPYLRLPPHERACISERDLPAFVREIRSGPSESLIAADLFAGAGGLSLGLEQAGIEVVLSVDHDADSVETHRHHFRGLSVDWDLSDPEVVSHTGRLLKRLKIDVIAGGPPCQPFSKAGRSGIRHYVRTGVREARDERRDLWQSFLEIIRIAKPRAVVMENVPDMALDREMFILRTFVHELESLGYAVEARVVDAWRYGVPQFRQRLILVALRRRIQFLWPEEAAGKTTVENAIGDLPPVEGGWRPEGGSQGWVEYPGPKSTFQKLMRSGVSAEEADKVFDHITRPVRADDAAAFELMGPQTRYSDLPQELKRYRDDIFDDKYKRLDPHDLSRTITAHIAKDGYWYIHPYQGRTLTVREAARLQTFPDSYRFAGPPSSAFRQIGNAVPPMLGRAVGRAITEALQRGEREPHTSEKTAATLADWFRSSQHTSLPWLAAKSRWQVISAEAMLERASASHIRHIWPLLERWSHPDDTAANVDSLLEIGHWIGRDQACTAAGGSRRKHQSGCDNDRCSRS